MCMDKVPNIDIMWDIHMLHFMDVQVFAMIKLASLYLDSYSKTLQQFRLPFLIATGVNVGVEGQALALSNCVQIVPMN